MWAICSDYLLYCDKTSFTVKYDGMRSTQISSAIPEDKIIKREERTKTIRLHPALVIRHFTHSGFTSVSNQVDQKSNQSCFLLKPCMSGANAAWMGFTSCTTEQQRRSLSRIMQIRNKMFCSNLRHRGTLCSKWTKTLKSSRGGSLSQDGQESVTCINQNTSNIHSNKNG